MIKTSVLLMIKRLCPRFHLVHIKRGSIKRVTILRSIPGTVLYVLVQENVEDHLKKNPFKRLPSLKKLKSIKISGTDTFFIPATGVILKEIIMKEDNY